MNQQLQHRLVGAVVLLSLAIIFIPMMLTGKQAQIDVPELMPMPDAPVFVFENLEIPELQEIPVMDRVVLEQASEPAVSEIATQTEPKDTNPSTSQPMPAQQKPKPTVAATSVPFAKAVQLGWIVQVASLSQKEKALLFRDRLMKAGFSAFVMEHTEKGKSWYRVRVGPVATEAEARKIQGQVEKEFKERGKIMRHG